MPLLTADYGGGIIVTDWYNSTNDENQSIKISIQFLSNEIRSDALDIKVFKKNFPNLEMYCRNREEKRSQEAKKH